LSAAYVRSTTKQNRYHATNSLSTKKGKGPSSPTGDHSNDDFTSSVIQTYKKEIKLHPFKQNKYDLQAGDHRKKKKDNV
jgi:hypothetical protein